MYTIRVNASDQNKLIEVLNTLYPLEIIFSIDYIPKLNSNNQSPLSSVVNKPEDERLYIEPLKRRGRPKSIDKQEKTKEKVKKTKTKKINAEPLIKVPTEEPTI